MTTMPTDIELTAMQRCLELASHGRRFVAPNPMVGAILLLDGKVIAEGFHTKKGAAHAEVEAINSLHDKSLLPRSTLVVNLEPCSHFGKTPPCSDFVIKAGIRRVVVGARDTSPKVNGAGIHRLQLSGIDVVTDVLLDESRDLNRRFFTFHERQRPYVILKWAETSDGFMAGDAPDTRWISSEDSRALVHEWRAEESAIMVGTGTAKLDNPKLTARPISDGEYRQPLRVVIDRHLTLPTNLDLFNTEAETLVINSLKDDNIGNLRWAKIDFSRDVIKQALASLYQQKITSLIVEGGSRLLQSFLAADMWDEARVFTAPKKFGGGVKAPLLPIPPISSRDIGPDKLNFYNNSNFKAYEFTKNK